MSLFQRVFGLVQDLFFYVVSVAIPVRLVVSPVISPTQPHSSQVRLELQHPIAIQKVYTTKHICQTRTLLIHRQQQVNLLQRWTGDDLKVFSAVFLLKQSVQSLEYLLDVIPNRLEKDELGVSIG